MKYIFFIAFNMSTLYGMQDESVKVAFNQLEKPMQEEVCKNIQHNKKFIVYNNAHTRLYQQRLRLPSQQEAVQMIKLADEDRVRIFKGSCNFEVLIAAFNKLCT